MDRLTRHKYRERPDRTIDLGGRLTRHKYRERLIRTIDLGAG